MALSNGSPVCFRIRFTGCRLPVAVQLTSDEFEWREKSGGGVKFFASLAIVFFCNSISRDLNKNHV